MTDLKTAYIRDGKIEGHSAIRVHLANGVKLGYAVREAGRGKWVCCIYDGPVSIENHRQITASATSKRHAFERILGWHTIDRATKRLVGRTSR